MKIYVVIVTYNGAPWIGGALASLRQSEMPCVPVVVDNASTDDTADIVARDFPEAILVRDTDNNGFGIGNNKGISIALAQGADYVFLLNQDAFVTPPAIGMLVDFLERHPEYGIATPLHCSPDLGALDPTTQRAYLQPYAPAYLSDACVGQVKESYEIRGINAAAWMIRSSVFQVVGGFDPIFFMYGEDDDLINRFSFHKQRFVLVPGSRIVHLRARSARGKVSLGQELWNKSERVRSGLILDLKRPRGNPAGKLLRLFARGVVAPVAAVLADQDWKKLCATWLATGRILLESPTIFRRGKLCGSKGPHFLDLEVKR
jgi:GT2 family glycosyltransferase